MPEPIRPKVSVSEVRVSDAILKAHGLRSMGERPTPATLLEMADALRAAAYDALNGEIDA